MAVHIPLLYTNHQRLLLLLFDLAMAFRAGVLHFKHLGGADGNISTLVVVQYIKAKALGIKMRKVGEWECVSS